jgi:autotransporter-associated beta strand protein
MTYSQSGGLFTFNTGTVGGFLQTAFQTTAPTTMSISGGTFQVATNNIFYLGCRTSSTVTISGNALVTTGTLSFNRAAATTGAAASVVNLNGGILQPTVILESYNGTVGTGGTLNLNGGTLQASPSAVAAWIPANTAHLMVSVNSGGAFIDTNGQNVTIAQPIVDGTGGAADSLTKLNNGMLTLTGASTYQGTTTISGGTLQLGNGGTTGALASAGSISIGSGATLAFNRTNSPNQGSDFSTSGISGAGGLVQLGPGTLTLNATNTYSGPTLVNTGALAVNGALTQTSTVTVATGGTLSGSGQIGGNTTVTTLTGNATINLSNGTIGGPLNVTGGNWFGSGTVNGLVTSSSNVFTVANGSTMNAVANINLSGGTLTGQGTITGGTLTLGSGAAIAPGATANTNNVGTLALPSLTTGGGGTLSFDLSNSAATLGANDLINVSGNVSLGGTTTVTINPTAGNLAFGTPYTLLSYVGNLTHSGVLNVVSPGAIGGRATPSIDYGTGNNSLVTMTLSGYNANLTWIGTSSTVWANNTSIKPWTSPTSPSGDFFTTADACTFDNNAVATSISLSGSLLPSSVTVTGTNNFTYSGSGSIGGLTGITITGPGSLTIGNTGNSYGGATLVQGGTLTAGANNAFRRPARWSSAAAPAMDWSIWPAIANRSLRWALTRWLRLLAN